MKTLIILLGALLLGFVTAFDPAINPFKPPSFPAAAINSAISAIPPTIIPSTQQATRRSAASTQQKRVVDYPATIQLGTLTAVKCLEDNLFGVDGIYCFNLTVPLDPEHPILDPRKIKVAFMVHVGANQLTTTGPQRKAIMIPMGGPGLSTHVYMGAGFFYSLLLSDYSGFASDYLGIPLAFEDYDLITFDERGMGWSCGMSCVEAYATAQFKSFSYSSDIRSFSAATAKLERECVGEIFSSQVQSVGHSDECIVGSFLDPRLQRIQVIPYMGSKYVARDMEAFRAAVGYPTMTLYGSSYGSIISQVYATLFPSRVDSMILNSPETTLSSAAGIGVSCAESRRIYLARLARLCAEDDKCRFDGCPSCNVNDIDTAEKVILSKFHIALNATTAWPKQVSYRWFNPDTAAIEEVYYEISRTEVEVTIATAIMNRVSYRSLIARMLLAAANTGDYSKFVQYWMYYNGVNPITQEIPSVLMNVLNGDSAITTFPLVWGKDRLYRSSSTPNFKILTASDRLKQYFETYQQQANLNAAMGASVANFDAIASSFGWELAPRYSDQYQNTSVLPMPGFHAYPVYVFMPGTDSMASSIDAIKVYQDLAATGPTYLVQGHDLAHAPLASWMLEDNSGADAGYLSTYFTMLLAFFGVPLGPDPIVYGAMTPFPNYRPLPPTTTLTSANDVLKYVDSELLSSLEFKLGSSYATACSKDGFITFAPNELDGTYTITFVSCSVNEGMSVSGTAIYNPSIVFGGQLTATNTLIVSGLSDGEKICSYDRIQSEDPIISCSVYTPTPSARSVNEDNKVAVKSAHLKFVPKMRFFVNY